MKPFLAFSLLTLICLTSCTKDNDPVMFQEDLSGSYSYNVIISCFCTPSYRGPNAIVLEDGVVTKFNGKNVVASDSNYEIVQSLGLDDLIQAAEDIIDNNPIEETIEYHSEYGFISNCFFDRSTQIADDEWGFAISDFTVL